MSRNIAVDFVQPVHVAALTLLMVLAAPVAHAADPLVVDLPEQTQQVLLKAAPESIEDLKLIEEQTQAVVDKVVAATVGVRIGGFGGGASGSGVIISEDGLVLTAAHVNGKPGRKVRFFFPDGRQANGITLGMNTGIDSGLMKITDEGPWPFVEMGTSDDILPGKWCIAIGHPGGFDLQRPYVVRLGRVIRIRGGDNGVIQTDCTLVGGDSGGPLFDMQGRVIGIHSRISIRSQDNFHVPIQTYTETFSRLVAGEEFDGRDKTGAPKGGPYVGVLGNDMPGDPKPKGVLITGVSTGTPASRAGLVAGDIVKKFDETDVNDWAHFAQLIKEAGPDTKVVLLIDRDGSQMSLQLTIGRR